MGNTTEIMRVLWYFWLTAPYVGLAAIGWLVWRRRTGRLLVIAGGIVMAIPNICSVWYICHAGPEGGRAILVAPILQLPFICFLGLVCGIVYRIVPVCRRHRSVPALGHKMKYEDCQTVMLGDIVRLDLHDGDHTGRVIMIGDTGEYDGIDAQTANWALESGHVGKQNIMLEWVELNPLAHNDPKYAPVSNTLSTSLRGVSLIRRKEQSQQGGGEERR